MSSVVGDGQISRVGSALSRLVVGLEVDWCERVKRALFAAPQENSFNFFFFTFGAVCLATYARGLLAY